MNTTTRLALIDLEGVVANCDARFARAKGIADATYDEGLWPREYSSVFWREVFQPEHIHLDTLMDGVHAGLERLQEQGYLVVLYSSRPEAMRAQTLAWLAGQAVVSSSGAPLPLLLKAPAFQFVKTPVWFAGMVQTLVATGKVADLVIVDDEEVRHQELFRSPLPASVKWHWYWNLQLGDEETQEEASLDEPF